MSAIPPLHFQAVAQALTERLDFLTWDSLLYELTGKRELYNIAAEAAPRGWITLAVLSFAQDSGLLEMLLRQVLLRWPKDEALKELLVRAMPALAKPPRPTSERVDGVVQSLLQAQQRLREPAIRQKIDVSQQGLELIWQRVTALRTYKELHDCLHQVQMRRFGDLRAAVRAIEQPGQIDRLRDFRDQIRTPIANAVDALASIADGAAQATEARWVKPLEKSADGLQEAIDGVKPDRALAAVCLNVIAGVLREHPPRLNWLIVQHARDLPLADVASALRAIDVASGGDAMLAAGAQRLDELRAALTARVVLHDRWQQVDETLWALDQALLQSAVSAIADFVLTWPQTRQAVKDLAVSDPVANWAVRCLRYASVIDEHLTIVEPFLDGADGATAARDELQRRYGAFGSEARFQFFAIDRALRQDCAELIRISDPVRDLLSELEHD